MGLEIERRFLIEDRAGAAARATRGEDVRQGYVAVDPDGTQVRVRSIGERRLMTVKDGSGGTRAEVEFEVPADVFEELWELTAGRRIAKRRMYVDGPGGLTFEIDLYGPDLDELAVVEVEFPSEAEAAGFDPPDWFARELTGDERYSNVRLAFEGLPSA